MNLQALYRQPLSGGHRTGMPVLNIITALLLAFLASTANADIDLVKVDKSERRMYLIADNEVVRAYRIALGGNPKGHKQQEGDQRTPEGEYTLDYTKEDSAFYRAMHISYPNEFDTANALQNGVSPGGFIMVHGQREGLGLRPSIVQKFDWTDGCIALTNPEMDEFMSLVEVGTKISIEW
ncbi:L,D-transpeptidase family protein [Marinimicrobium sp. C2-29]|uniref:L,D-transpeptidase family protein n=1 Tax=Marinimicrobium sp. C2-29 TaxID=3139825 RepID=UPI003138F147